MSLADPARPANVLCAGIAVQDYVFKLDRFPHPGEKRRATEFIAVGGGCAANAAVAIVRLGGRARLAAPLGGPAGFDSVGDQILAELAAVGVDCGGAIRLQGATSPLSAIFVDASGERMIVNHRHEHLSDARVADPAQLFDGIDAVLVDNRFSGFVLPLCEEGRARLLPVVLDGDRPTREGDTLFQAVSHIVFAADGLRATTDQNDLEQGLRRIACSTAAFLAVTDGSAGVFWLEDGEIRHRPAFAVDAVDTLAAGDVFHGAFALALAEGKLESEAIDFANAAAALKCTRFGGSRGSPERAEVVAFLAEQGR